MILTSITGSPIGSLVILAVIWWTLDRYTFQVLPDPLKGFLRWQRGSWLRRTIAHNPNDRRARFELADILVQQRRHAAAVEVLRPNVEAGEDDAQTLFLLGIASTGAGQLEQAERLFKAVREEDEDFKHNEIDLALGRARLLRGDTKGAEESLTAFIQKRRSTVEARVLLAKLREKAGDSEAAKKLRGEAWQEYVSAPPFHRRRDRLWAWRANPKRPIIYAAVAIVLAVGFARYGAPALARAVPPNEASYDE
jgi:tetratricopeptide (TPR) repeat protein